MPKFSDVEKEKIQKMLLTEGESLFTAHGIKKVTIDDIVKSVNIAKATFYRFYEGKEYLYLDIIEKQQEEIFEKLTNVMERNRNQPNKLRVKNIFFEMFKLMPEYPMLQKIDSETVNIITRKISKERIEQYGKQGFDAVKTIESYGVHFKYEGKVIEQVFHALYESWILLQKQSKAMQKTVIDIMLDGIIEQIL